MKDHIGLANFYEIENGKTVCDLNQVGLKQREQVRVADVAGRDQRSFHGSCRSQKESTKSASLVMTMRCSAKET